MSDRPTILLLTHTAELSGAELSLLRLLRELDATRFDCRVLLFSDGPLAPQLRSAGIAVDILPLSEKVAATSRHDAGRALLRFAEVTATASHVWRVARFIRSNRIDLVHTHSLKSHLIGGVASRLAGRPCIWHLHARIAEDYMPPRLARLLRFLARTVPQYIIANSQATLNSVVSRPETKRCWVIYPGTQVRDFSAPSSPSAPSKMPTVGTIGRISSTKGQDVFLRAAARVLQRMPAVRFQVIGSAMFNDLPFEHELHELADSLGIAAAVEFIGFVNDVAQRLHALDILVLASTVPEPFGQIVVEAMAASKPVIATNAGGVPEIISHGETGLLIDPGNMDQLAEAICELLDHPEAAGEMARRGEQRAAGRFTVERMAHDIEAVYEEILG